MRINHSCAGVLLLVACAHGSEASRAAQPEAAGSAARGESLGQLQPSPVATEARHEPSTPDPSVEAPAAPVPVGGDEGREVAGSAPAPSAGGEAPQPTRQESALRERIQRRLLQDKRLSYTAQRVRLEVKRSDVTVHGEVRTAREKQTVEELIESISGVRRVDNQLAVIDQTDPAAPSGLHTR